MIRLRLQTVTEAGADGLSYERFFALKEQLRPAPGHAQGLGHTNPTMSQEGVRKALTVRWINCAWRAQVSHHRAFDRLGSI
jgi:hypothetical protein